MKKFESVDPRHFMNLMASGFFRPFDNKIMKLKGDRAQTKTTFVCTLLFLVLFGLNG